ncbi:MAG: substrate-binding domain-containing protein [Myxococcales bacterium]|jgi:putative molybdopterin biosynthesis protein
MPDDLLNTKEVAAFLGIHEKQVYALIKEKRLPATRLTGKWLFPRKLLEEWLETDARAAAKPPRGTKRSRPEGALLASGSDDPCVSLLSSLLSQQRTGVVLYSASTGSSAGLRAVNRGASDLAWSHLLDPQSGEYNLPFLDTLAPDIAPAVVNLFYRDLGLVVAKGNPLGLCDWADLGREGLRIVNRQAGSGTRLLTEARLAKAGVEAARISGWEREVCTHYEVGLAVRAGEADAGLAAGTVARLLGLGFVPLLEERFDMVLDQSTFFDEGFRALMDVVTSASFRERVAGMGHYDLRDSGKLLSKKRAAGRT